jgi:hypothetical protein
MSGSTNPFAFGTAKAGYGYYATHPVTSSGGGHHGVMGFFGNLGSDIRDMAVGLPTGIVSMVAHPIRGVKAAASQTWHDWSPLFHGHVGEWGHNFYSHPLGPILDVATLLTGGAGAAGKLARVADSAGAVGEGSRIARLADYSRGGKLAFKKEAENGAKLPTYTKALSKNPLTRLRQESFHEMLNAHEAHLPKFLHYDSRYNRLANKDLGERRAAFMSQVATYTDAGRKLHGPEALKYRTQVLKHSYNTIKQFAIRHEVSGHTFVGKDGETYLRLPKEGNMEFRAIKREPRAGKITAQLKQLRNETAMHSKKMADIRAKLDFNHGVKVTSAGDARVALTQAKKDVAAAKAAFKPSGLHVTRQKLIESYIQREKAFRSAAQRQARHETARGKLVDGFFKPGKNFESDMHNFARRYSAAGQKGAVRLKDLETVDGGKHALIVPEHVISRFGLEGANTSGLLKKLYTKPTSIWKHMILGYRPAYFVNNAVGNHLMYMMAHDPIAVVRGYRDALRQVHSERAVTKSLHKAEAVFKGQDFQNKYFKGQLTNTLADSTLGRTMVKGSRGRVGQTLRQGFFGVTHNVADRMVRRATINNVLREQPAFQTMLKKVEKEINPKTKARFTPAEAFNEAAHRVLKSDYHGELRRYISGRVNDVMGDYHSYNPLEQKIKAVVPFYAWDRHLARHMKQLVNERPWKADALGRIGQQGSKENQQLLGDVPQFLKGALPLSLLGLHADHPGRQALLSTTGLNPYATLPDAADAVGAILGHPSTGGGESIGGQLNPLVNSAVEVLTGRSTLTGAPIHSSVPALLRPYTDLVGNLPQWKLIKAAMEGAPHPKPNKRTGKTNPFLFEKNFGQYLSQLLGVPVDQMSPASAKSMAKRQRSPY